MNWVELNFIQFLAHFYAGGEILSQQNTGEMKEI